jgi:ABC-type uncharacterized transport system ATPase subunit
MVADLSDRMHVLDYGRTLAEGAPGAVLRDARVVAAYLGRKAPSGRPIGEEIGANGD